MRTLVILGKKVKVGFRLTSADEDALFARLEAMAATIAAAAWDAEETRAFRAMRKIVMFEGVVKVGGWTVARPGCDEAQGVFYWKVDEFLANPDPAVHASIYVHDCWHVLQHRRDGGAYAWDEGDQVEREVEALDRQIDAARRMGCNEHKLAFLQAFRDDRQRILARLTEGVVETAPERMEG